VPKLPGKSPAFFIGMFMRGQENPLPAGAQAARTETGGKKREALGHHPQNLPERVRTHQDQTDAQ
jgi:hypothetical protein